MAAQEQVIRSNAIKAKIDKTQAESKCRMFGKVCEIVRYIFCKCSLLKQKEALLSGKKDTLASM